ncbi:alpha/beta hydrolase [Caldibacillus lycopersici]|uniref:Alpha/beta hydrolase n=2 Tax=Perspicuibacillus lycopersici TaxID=1325689 RepID=A0AAE3IWR8_9BACI|nr:alpha/beta hydrolase [Perspicuibacillus lycopersici]MCU9614811.1 alpha/beta hydrolase [Perspicuibacillus lycopersici]
MLLWENGAPFAKGSEEEDRPTLIPYLINKKEKHGAIIVCPGGGYGFRADHEGEPVANWLNSIGISAFVLHYRVAPYRHPAPLVDAQRAIRTVRFYAEEWNIDPNKIGILGFSAGGHLASTAATLFDKKWSDPLDDIDLVSSRPNLAVLCYPVISLQHDAHIGSVQNLLGSNPDETLQAALSSENNVTAQTPPVFLWHTADDETVAVENSLMFAYSLSKHKIPYALHIFQNGRHGLGLAKEDLDVSQWTQMCESWLKQQGMVQ